MSRDSWREWLEETPDDWDPPDELLRPSRFPEANLAIRMLGCDFLGHDVRVALGRFITEHSLFVMWFLRSGKSGSLRESGVLAALPDEQTRQVYLAWKRFEEIENFSQPDEVVRERRSSARSDLVKALERATSTMAEARSR